MDPLSSPVKAEVLLVEDSWGDVLLMREAFREARLPFRLNIVTNGEEAMAYLNRESKYADTATPDLILLDLNLPRMDGRVFLRRLRGQDRFNHLRVVVLTSSGLESDRREVVEMKVHGYLVKPSDLKGFLETAKKIREIWLQAAGPPLS